MSDNNEQIVITVNDHQHEEGYYVDLESPTLAVPQYASPTTGPVERLTDVVVTDQNADKADILLPRDALSLATSTDEASTTSFPAPKRGCRLSTDTDVMYIRYNTSP